MSGQHRWRGTGDLVCVKASGPPQGRQAAPWFGRLPRWPGRLGVEAAAWNRLALRNQSKLDFIFHCLPNKDTRV